MQMKTEKATGGWADFRHLGEYPIRRQPDGSWNLYHGEKLIAQYKSQSFRAARLRRKALMAGVPVNRARGLPE